MKFVWTRIQNVGDNNCKVISLHNRVNGPEGVVLLFLQPREGKSYFSKKHFWKTFTYFIFNKNESIKRLKTFTSWLGPVGKTLHEIWEYCTFCENIIELLSWYCPRESVFIANFLTISSLKYTNNTSKSEVILTQFEWLAQI